MNVPRMTGLACALLIAAVAAAQDEPPVPRVGNPHGSMDLDCRLCHDQDSWDVSPTGSFDHDGTGFPLEGRHRQALCRDCHREPVFAHVGTHCADCHEDVHRGRSGPDCVRCHTPAGWFDEPRMRREHDATALPLVGAHERVDCVACHAGAVTGDYVGTPTDCYACHRADYEGTDDPDHATAGFATDCERCHGVFSSTWGAGDFIHAQGFPLTGAHARLSCTECHGDGFTGTPAACVTCHQADYDGTTNPPHVPTGFSTACADCHRTTSWVPSDWNHDGRYFPVYSGRHRGEWDSCTECHVVPTDYTVFECILCHEHDDPVDLARRHDDENGYVYLSTACYQCHPDGRADD